MTSDKALLRTVLDLVDVIVELYLGNIIKPFLTLHEKFYSALNSTLRSVLDNNRDKIPDWFTANWITYSRTLLVIPCVLMLSWGHTFLPCFIVILVDFGDFFDGVVARFWIDIKKEREEALFKKGDKPRSRSVSPVNSDDDSFGACIQGARETEFLMLFSCFVLTNCRSRHYWISSFFVLLGGFSSQPHLRGLCGCCVRQGLCGALLDLFDVNSAGK
jgi:hypothetical protein